MSRATGSRTFCSGAAASAGADHDRTRPPAHDPGTHQSPRQCNEIQRAVRHDRRSRGGHVEGGPAERRRPRHWYSRGDAAKSVRTLRAVRARPGPIGTGHRHRPERREAHRRTPWRHRAAV